MTSATQKKQSNRQTVLGVLVDISEANQLLALLDDITDYAEEIHLEGDSVVGFKHSIYTARTKLDDARETLSSIAHCEAAGAE